MTLEHVGFGLVIVALIVVGAVLLAPRMPVAPAIPDVEAPVALQQAQAVVELSGAVQEGAVKQAAIQWCGDNAPLRLGDETFDPWSAHTIKGHMAELLQFQNAIRAGRCIPQRHDCIYGSLLVCDKECWGKPCVGAFRWNAQNNKWLASTVYAPGNLANVLLRYLCEDKGPMPVGSVLDFSGVWDELAEEDSDGTTPDVP